MKTHTNTIPAFIHPDDPPFCMAECLVINVVTQSQSLGEVIANLKEAEALFFKGEDAVEFGYVEGITPVHFRENSDG